MNLGYTRGLEYALAVLLSFLFSANVGMLLSWVDRFVSARVQMRKGPPIFQPWADLLKLSIKQTIVPAGAHRATFLLAPLLGLAGMCLVGALLFYVNYQPDGSFIGDILVLIYLFALPPLGVLLGASASRNPLAAVGASREMTLYLGYEFPFVLALLVPVIKANGALRLGEMVRVQLEQGPFLYSISGVLAAVIILLVIQAKLGLVPFDMAEAEQEIMGGVFVEYSGVTLAAFRITRAMMLLLLPVFLVTVLWGGVRDWWAVLKILAVVVPVILVKNTNPRLRVDQALRFFWFVLGAVGIAAVILASVGL